MDGSELWSTDQGWWFRHGNAEVGDESYLRSEVSEGETYYYLKQPPGVDRIEVAKRFIQVRSDPDAV